MNKILLILFFIFTSVQGQESVNDSLNIELFKKLYPRMISKIYDYNLKDTIKFQNYNLPFEDYNFKDYNVKLSDTLFISKLKPYKLENNSKIYICNEEYGINYKLHSNLLTNKNLVDKLRVSLSNENNEIQKLLRNQILIYENSFSTNLSSICDSINFGKTKVILEKIKKYDTIKLTVKDINKEFSLNNIKYKVRKFYKNTLEIVKYDSLSDDVLYSANINSRNELILNANLKDFVNKNEFSKLFLFNNNNLTISEVFLDEALINSDSISRNIKIDSIFRKAKEEKNKTIKTVHIFKFPNNISQIILFVPVYEVVEEKVLNIKYINKDIDVKNIHIYDQNINITQQQL